MHAPTFFAIASVLVAFQAVSASPTKFSKGCDDSTISICKKSGVRELCQKAASKFKDDVVYGRDAAQSASDDDYTCVAAQFCDSSVIKHGHISYDKTSGYDLKYL